MIHKFVGFGCAAIVSVSILSLGRVSAAPAQAPGNVQEWLTTGDGAQKLARQPDLIWNKTAPPAGLTISVDETQRYQPIAGFGASIPDKGLWAADPEVRETAMRLLFSRSGGIGLSMLRVPLGSLANSGPDETYDDMPPGQTDPALTHFNAANDLVWRLPLVEEARRLNPDLTLVATPWSAPAWMKDSGDLGKGTLLPQYYTIYAQYLVHWLSFWRDHGVPVSAITLQNEPQFAPGWYQGMTLKFADEDRLAEALGPLLAAAHLKTQIWCYDHNWDHPDYPIQALHDAQARRWISGVAFHGYAGSPEAMGQVHQADPDKALYFTEATGGLPGDGFGGSMQYHLRYFFITPLRNWSRSVLLWKLDRQITDATGDRPFVSFSGEGRRFTLYGEYYETGQFSTFVVPGAVRIASDNPGQASGFQAGNGQPLTVAFQDPNGAKVLVVATPGPAQTFAIKNDGRYALATVPAGSVATFVWHDKQKRGR